MKTFQTNIILIEVDKRSIKESIFAHTFLNRCYTYIRSIKAFICYFKAILYLYKINKQNIFVYSL